MNSAKKYDIEKFAKFIPVFITLIILTGALFLWISSTDIQNNYVNKITQLQLEGTKHEILDRLDNKILSLRRMALRWKLRGGTPRQEWEQDALSHLSDFKGFKAIGWIDDTYHIRWIAPLSGNESAQDYDLSSDRICKILLENSRKTRQIRITPPLELVQGKKGFLVFVPINMENSFGGFMLGVFDHKSLFEAILQNIAPDYSIEISEGPNKIYIRQEQGRAGFVKKWASQDAINIYGVAWNVKVWPTPRQYIKLKSSVPDLILIFGVILSALFGLIAYLGVVIRRRAIILGLTNKKLAFELDELKKAEEEIGKLYLAIEASPTAIIITDTKGNIEYVNPQFTKLTGYEKGEVVGRTPKILSSGEHPKEFYENLWHTITSDKEWHGEIHNKKKNGHLYWEDTYIGPVKNSQGQITHFVSIKQDVTERKKNEEWLKKSNDTIRALYKELELKNKELEKLDQLKSDFVSTVSHELRTPLSVTKEAISLITDKIAGPLNAQQEKFLNTAIKNIDRLARLICDLLDISKIEAGKLELKREIVNMTAIIKQMVNSFEPKIKDKGLELKVNLEKEDITVYADKDKLSQVLTNLIDNAIKFTREGQIAVAIYEKDEFIECVVADTGFGISKSDLPDLFSKFKQFAKHEFSREQGTGLGLSIARGIVELHGGRIWAESEPGIGSRFIFTVPKITPKDIFKKNIVNALKQSGEKHSKMSIIAIGISDFERVKEMLTSEKLYSMIDSIEHNIKNTLHKTTDVILKEKSEFIVLLPGCNKENALKVQARLTRVLNVFITNQVLPRTLKLIFASSTYPDDAANEEELLDQALKNMWFE